MNHETMSKLVDNKNEIIVYLHLVGYSIPLKLVRIKLNQVLNQCEREVMICY